MVALWTKLTGEEVPFAKSKVKEQAKEFAAPLPDDYLKKIRKFTPQIKTDITRYLHIFNNDITPVLKYIDEMATEGRSDYFKNQDQVEKDMSEKDRRKYKDYIYTGKGVYDMTYRKDSYEGKNTTDKMITSGWLQPAIGVSTGVYQTIAGTAELGAALSDLYLDTDALSKVEKALPAIDLMDVYGDSRGSVAKFTSILVQYGLGWGIARKIATKVIGKMAKTKLAQKVGGKLAKVAIPSLTGTKTGMDIARFGGYWVLPAALGDAVVSNQANISLGDAFGNEEGGFIARTLADSKTESLEGLTGKERAAAILRNKLKFAGEGAALFGGITLVGPALKGFFKGLGKGIAGHTVKAGEKPGLLSATKGAAGLGEGKELFHIPGAGSLLTGLGKGLAYQTKAKNPLGLPAGIGIPILFRGLKKGWKWGMSKTGIPKRELWKFSDWNGSFWEGLRRNIDDWALAPLTPSWKFDKGSATAMRMLSNRVRKVKKNFDIWKRQLDRAMYGLVKAGASDIAFQTRTATKALSQWDNVLKYMRGEIKLDALPKALRLSSRAIRQMIDDQTKELTPIIRDMNVRDELIKNMGKYLHTSYEIFRNSKWRASKEVYNKGVEYFVNLIRQGDPKYAGVKKGSRAYAELLTAARLKVSEIMDIGRTEGTTPAMRLASIMNKAAEIKVPANIFKDIKNVPEEIANLLGKVRDPQSIILNTLVEQAHTIHSYNAYRELANQGLGKWIFKNMDEYKKFITDNKIVSPRTLAEIKIKKPYNMDLEDIFKNADGTPMLAIPEMAKAISDQTLLVDIALKFPFWKAALAIKTGTQVNKTVLSIMTQMRNITTASMFAMANGHVGKGASVADNFEILWKELVGKTDDPQKLRKILDEALEAGALDSSTIATELEKLIPELLGPSKVPVYKSGKITGKTVSDWASTGAVSDEIFERLLTQKGAIGRLVQKSIEAYQLGDNVWKLFGFQYTKSQLKPAFRTLDDVKTYFREVEGFEWNPYKTGSTTAGKHGQNLKTIDDAINEVSGLIVRDTYPNYSMVPRAVQTIRKIPFFGNFVGFSSEMWRNSYEILRRGTAEMASSNPYIRQIGARRLLGYMTTVGTITPLIYNLALKMTGVPDAVVQAYKERFSADYQLGHTLIPISKQDPETKKIKYVDSDTLHPYSDVQKPFRVFMQKWNAGKKTDQSTLGLFRESMIATFKKAIEPFVSWSIAAETIAEMTPDKDGVARSNSGTLIADWENDTDPFSSTLYYGYSKLLPTTLKSAEKIYRAFNGQVSRSAVEYDPMQEVAATLAGFRTGTMDGFKGMKYKIGRISGELSAARKVFINRSIGANTLMDDFNRIAQGLSPININKQFNNYQKNRYRIWSEAYKDIEALRIMNYTETQIRDMIVGRRAFSEDEVSMLMLGRYTPAKVPTIELMEQNGFAAQIREINREKGTFYTPNQFYNVTELWNIANMWVSVPLGKDLNTIEEELGVPWDIRGKEIKEEGQDYKDIIIQQRKEDRERWKKQQEGFQESIKNQKSSVPINTPPIDTEIFTASRVSPTISGTVDQTTGLTGTQSALLSPLEQEIAKKRNQGIGSLA